MNNNINTTIANAEEIKAASEANPDMVLPKEMKDQKKAEAKAKAKMMNSEPQNKIDSTNIVDHLMNGSVICPADVSSHGLKKSFWRELVGSFGCVYTSPLKPAAQIVLVTPKDNSPKFERAVKQGMNCVEYPKAVEDLRTSANEEIVEFLASNEEWQEMLKREEEAKQKVVKMMANKVAMAERLAQRAAERAAKLKAETTIEVPVNDIPVPAEAKEVVAEQVEETKIVTENNSDEISAEITG